MSFAKFMQQALYCPKIGYYERERQVLGPEGDFYTSVSGVPLFAELLAFQASAWLQELGNGPFAIVEGGAHEGKLAWGILDWFQKCRPELFNNLTYWLVEPSETRKAWQSHTLDKFARQVRWGQTIDELPPVKGLILSNELLDAMPLHRVVWRQSARRWRELGVGLEGEKFVWIELPEPTLNIADELAASGFELPDELMAAIPDGFCLEVCPSARDWWFKAAGALQRGKLLTIDYGLAAEEFLSPQRREGTLRSYRRHHEVANVLAEPGEQDITAHLNFTQLIRAGEAAGLKTSKLESQEKFLGTIFGNIVENPSRFGGWTPMRTGQLQTLIHPEHLGRPFRVLVQSRT
ncbi:MAG TPA: SAM-dependent methyltransferase [Candidatus Saccharimonadales bacterium]|nr:SAM-dependent methyltransferase [Candidatus Saccharimonadales bacterium]